MGTIYRSESQLEEEERRYDRQTIGVLCAVLLLAVLS